MAELPENTRNRVRTVAQLIKTYIPTEHSNQSYEKFILSLQDFKHNAIDAGCDAYVKGNHYLDMKGYSYVLGIIRKTDKNWESQLLIEKKRYGSGQPKLEV